MAWPFSPGGGVIIVILGIDVGEVFIDVACKPARAKMAGLGVANGVVAIGPFIEEIWETAPAGLATGGADETASPLEEICSRCRLDGPKVKAVGVKVVATEFSIRIGCIGLVVKLGLSGAKCAATMGWG